MPSFIINPSAQQLMARAREQSGVTDIMDSEVEEALTVLLNSLNTQAELSEAGAIGMEDRLLNLLCNRLRMKRDFRAHPEIEAQQIVRPLIITGLPRTGSTKLHKMLAASGDFKSINFWQGYCMSLRTGDRGEDTMPRIRTAEAHLKWFDRQSPTAKLTHEFSTFETEEESLVLEHNICSNYPQAFAFVPDFLQWWAVQDPRKQIAFVKQGLKYLQWQFYDGDPRPWILKCPMYPGFEPLLAEVFPQALFVSTHRRSSDVISSGASLLHSYHKVYSDADRRQILGPALLGGMAKAIEGYMASRDAHPELNYLDAGYTAISAHAETLVEQIYAGAGMNLSATARQAMRDWARDNRQHKHGVHRHSLEEYSLTESRVNDQFQRYVDRYGKFF